jgi:hypothetical protein
MANVKMEFALDRQLGVQAPVVRMWLDTNRDMRLGDEEELSVQRRPGTLVFIAERQVDEDRVKGMPFRLKYFASPGSTWVLVIKVDGKDAYKANDTVVHAISGVVGNLRPVSA